MQVLWSHDGVTDEQREALLREVFNRITIDGKQFMSIEPRPAYVPLFASMATNEKLGYWEFDSTRSPLNYEFILNDESSLFDASSAQFYSFGLPGFYRLGNPN